MKTLQWWISQNFETQYKPLQKCQGKTKADSKKPKIDSGKNKPEIKMHRNREIIEKNDKKNS